MPSARSSKIDHVTHESNKRAIEQLRTLLRTGSVIPFVGAGLSIQYGLPGWSEFVVGLGAEAGIGSQVAARLKTGEFEEAVEDIIESFGRTSLDKRGVVEASQDQVQAEGNAVLSGYIYQQFGIQRTKQAKIIKALRILPKLINGPVVTTNFDRLLESAFGEAGRTFDDKIWGNHLSTMLDPVIRQRRRALIKLHGDAEDKDNRVLSLSEYISHYGAAELDYLDSNRPLPRTLQTIFQFSTVLFLGCGMANDRTIRLLRMLHTLRGPLGHFAIVEWPEEQNAFEEKRRNLVQSGIHPIWYPAGEHEWVTKILDSLLEAPALPVWFSALGFLLLLTFGVMTITMLSGRQPVAAKIETAKADVRGVAVIGEMARAMQIRVRYDFEGPAKDHKIVVRAYGPGGSNGRPKLQSVFGGEAGISPGKGKDVSTWIWTRSDLQITQIEGCVVQEERPDAGRPNSTNYGDSSITRDLSCDQTSIRFKSGPASSIELLSLDTTQPDAWVAQVKVRYAGESGIRDIRLVGQVFDGKPADRSEVTDRAESIRTIENSEWIVSLRLVPNRAAKLPGPNRKLELALVAGSETVVQTARAF